MSERIGFEVPEGKVLVDEVDLRVLEKWLSTFGLCRHIGDSGLAQSQLDDDARWAIAAIVRALPVPEWEPSDELVERWAATIAVIEGGKAAEGADPAYQSAARRTLPDLHAAGLLRDDL